MESLNLLNVSVQESECVFTCKVQHETQPPIQASLILSTAVQDTYKLLGSTGKLTSTPVSNWVTSVSKWNEVLTHRVPFDISSAACPLGPEMPAFLMAFLLGFKVVLVISFIATYFHRWWNL